jgi:biofilm PGA synthesis N-glycosyltransferase PgaC
MAIKCYVLITAVRNEENYIEKTIKSVLSQTLVPKRWVIVSDGSTDSTDAIVKDYSARFYFIRYERTCGTSKRDFSSKVRAINMAYDGIRELDFSFIGNLDGDVSFGPRYYESILNEFEKNDKLGIGGGFVLEKNRGEFAGRSGNTVRSVAGAIQLFRRECYESIGGYRPLELGGEDHAAEVMARMMGWEVEAFSGISVFHHRRTGTGRSNEFLVRFRNGVGEYVLGYHPLYELAKSVLRSFEKPYLVGSVLRLCGYWWAFLSRQKQTLSPEFNEYLRKEQIELLKAVLGNDKGRGDEGKSKNIHK